VLPSGQKLTLGLLAKVWGEVFAHCHAVAIKCHSSMWNWLFGLPGWILCKESSPLMLGTCSSPLSPFCLSEFWLFHWEDSWCLRVITVNPAPITSYHWYHPGQGQRFDQNLIHTHCSFVGSITKSHQARYNTPKKGHTKSACPPSCVQFCALSPKIC
jgi:hypothetical protein